MVILNVKTYFFKILLLAGTICLGVFITFLDKTEFSEFLVSFFCISSVLTNLDGS